MGVLSACISVSRVPGAQGFFWGQHLRLLHNLYYDHLKFSRKKQVLYKKKIVAAIFCITYLILLGKVWEE